MDKHNSVKDKSGIKSGLVFWKVYLIILVTVVLTACSGNSGGGGGSENTAPEGGVNPEELSGEIEVWGWNVAAASMELAAERFMEEYPDVTINVRDIGDADLYERMTVGMGSGGSGLPDVSIMHSDEIAGYTEQFPDQFLNLTEWGFGEQEDKFVDFKAEVIKNSEGNIIAMPWDIGPTGVFYRVDLFEEAGVNPEDIETWEDYMNVGETIKAETGVDMLPVEASSNDSIYRLMLNQQGVSYFTEENEINIASEESKRAMSVIQEMFERDIAATANDWDAQVGLVANGSVASIPIGVWYSGTIMDQAPDLAGQWDAFRIPAFEEGGKRAANMGGSDLIIPSSTDNPELAYAFAEYFTTNADIQVLALEEYGLFPSLLSAYEDPFFEEPVSYFNDSPIYQMFAEVAENVESSVYNGDFARAQDVIVDAQSDMLLEGADVDTALEEAAERLASETGNERADQ